VKFETGSQIGGLENGTFGGCVSLKSICIAVAVGHLLDRHILILTMIVCRLHEEECYF
jgi:hypothetical protein